MMKKPRLTPNGKYKQDLFIPLHPEKYVGNANEIYYRSGLEKRFMKRFDENPAVISWASEELAIPYISPADGKLHNYFPDFLVKWKTSSGDIITMMVEVKPFKEKVKPVRGNKSLNKFLQEEATYRINEAKWKHAMLFCKKHNMRFEVLTEKDIKIK